MTEDIVKRCKKFIENSNVLNFEKCCGIQANAFHLLRNCCVASKKNQDYIMYVNINQHSCCKETSFVYCSKYAYTEDNRIEISIPTYIMYEK